MPSPSQINLLDSRDMDKHIFSAALGLNKTIPFLGIEPLHSARAILDLRCCRSTVPLQTRDKNAYSAPNGFCMIGSCRGGRVTDVSVRPVKSVQLRVLAAESAHGVTGVASLILLADIGDQRLRALHFDFERGDQCIFGVNGCGKHAIYWIMWPRVDGEHAGCSAFNFSIPIVLYVRHPIWVYKGKQWLVRELPVNRGPYRSLRSLQVAAQVPSAGTINTPSRVTFGAGAISTCAARARYSRHASLSTSDPC